jgi:hypothetical protein
MPQHRGFTLRHRTRTISSLPAPAPRLQTADQVAQRRPLKKGSDPLAGYRIFGRDEARPKGQAPFSTGRQGVVVIVFRRLGLFVGLGVGRVAGLGQRVSITWRGWGRSLTWRHQRQVGELRHNGRSATCPTSARRGAGCAACPGRARRPRGRDRSQQGWRNRRRRCSLYLIGLVTSPFRPAAASTCHQGPPAPPSSTGYTGRTCPPALAASCFPCLSPAIWPRHTASANRPR